MFDIGSQIKILFFPAAQICAENLNAALRNWFIQANGNFGRYLLHSLPQRVVFIYLRTADR